MVFSDKIKSLQKDMHFFEMLKGGGATFALKILGMFFGYLLAMYITNNYGAEFFGQYVTALLVLEILSIVARLGIDTSIIKLISSYVINHQSDKIHSLYFKTVKIVSFSTLIFALFTYIFSEDIAIFLNTSDHFLRLVSLVLVPLVLFYINAQALRGLKKIVAFSFLNNIALVLGALVLLLIADVYSNHKELPIYAYTISVLLMTFLSFVLWYFHSKKYNFHKNTNTINSKELLKTSFPLLLGQSMMLIMGKVDLFMLAALTDQHTVGLYSVALKVSMLAYIGLMAINSIAAPKFAELYASKNYSALKKIVQQSTKTIFWITLPSVLIFSIFPEEILAIFGPEFVTAAYCLILLSLGKMFSAISGSVGTLLQMSGNQIYFQNVLIAAAVLNVVLNYFLIPIYGLVGAAIASMVSNIFWNILMIFYIKKHFGFLTIYIPFITR